MSNYDKQLSGLSLGQATEYQAEYAPELLQAVPRSLNREELNIVDVQPFFGLDVWHAYELSWLNLKGKPVVCLARFRFDASSPNIVESKSFKLYLNSYNQTRIESTEKAVGMMTSDLAKISGASVSVEIVQADAVTAWIPEALPGVCIDGLDIAVDSYELSPALLKHEPLKNKSGQEVISEVVHSHLLKSNCLITNQPDWASVCISYSGKKICHESLLRYLVSFRMHNEFHEQCVERIFMDIVNILKPNELTVQALYTRRGGLDINPFRTSVLGALPPMHRVNRQ